MRSLILGGLIFMSAAISSTVRSEVPIKVGLIGLDTSHAPAFTRLLNDKNDPHYFSDAFVVCAYPGGSPNVKASYTRVDQFTAVVEQQYGVKIVDSIQALLKEVDTVILTSVDGRVHLEQARPVIQSQKPIFIDKPLAASYGDAKAIFELAQKHNAPCFSSSSLRFLQELKEALADTTLGEITGCDVFSPCPIEPHHPDLFWYGIHGVELLFTVLGSDCISVRRTHKEETDIVTGIWKDGRIGNFRGIRKGKGGYGAVLYGEQEIRMVQYKSGPLYVNLMKEIIAFFKTGVPPVQPEETLAMFKFMIAADESKQAGGQAIDIRTPRID